MSHRVTRVPENCFCIRQRPLVLTIQRQQALSKNAELVMLIMLIVFPESLQFRNEQRKTVVHLIHGMAIGQMCRATHIFCVIV